nr:hypothetical protein [Micromonospora sp. DSM 115978]
HLLLATQRPSGVVSPEIRANTNLRIALRVTDVAESTDVVNAPDAARISKSTPGRAYARLGHTSLVPFQAGRVGGRRPGNQQPGKQTAASATAAAAALPPPWATELSWPSLGAPPTKPPRQAGGEADLTDLKVLVAAIREAAADNRIPAQ